MADYIGGKYELIEPAGEGGMASVWRGLTHGAAGFTRDVAIKRVHPELAADEEHARMFVEEARVVSDLQHPNIVSVHDFDQDDRGNYFLVMEWVDGIDLARWVRAHVEAKEATPWRYVAAIGIEVLRGLSAAHERVDSRGRKAPVIHRDVTPTNILLGRNGVVKLTDFGLARAMDRKSLTQAGVVKGKVSYMNPETLSGEPSTIRSDLYSLGTVLWEALTGGRLFEAPTDLEVAHQIVESNVPPLDRIRPGLPPALVEIVHCALAKEPNERFQTAREMQRALAAILRAQPEPTDAAPLSVSIRWALSRGKRKTGPARAGR